MYHNPISALNAKLTMTLFCSQIPAEACLSLFEYQGTDGEQRTPTTGNETNNFMGSAESEYRFYMHVSRAIN